MKHYGILYAALRLAAEYARYIERGDVVLAEQTRRTIDDLVGRPTAAGVRYPKPVAEAMGLSGLAVKP